MECPVSRRRRLAIIATAILVTPFASAQERFEHGRVHIDGETEIAYHVRPGKGQTLVLIPGSWGDYRAFDALLPHLPTSLHIVIVEMRGHGESGPPVMNGSIEMFADDVLRVIDHLRLDRYVVGGHSIGGMIAIEIAGRKPAGLAGIISMEGWTHHEVVRDAFDGEVNPTLTQEELERRAAAHARVKQKLTQEQIDAFGSVWRRWDGESILETTDLPVLEVWGDRAKPRPKRDKLRIPDRPNIQLVWIEGASHSFLIQNPAGAGDVIASFLDSLK